MILLMIVVLEGSCCLGNINQDILKRCLNKNNMALLISETFPNYFQL